MANENIDHIAPGEHDIQQWGSAYALIQKGKHTPVRTGVANICYVEKESNQWQVRQFSGFYYDHDLGLEVQMQGRGQVSRIVHVTAPDWAPVEEKN